MNGNTTVGGRRTASTLVVGLAAVLALTSCGRASGPVAEAAEPITTPAPTTAPTPTTTAAPTTTTVPETTTTVSTTTTTSSTTTTTSLPAEPAGPAPPKDDYSGTNAVVGDPIGSIAIPKLDVHMAMYEGYDMPILDAGPGHWPGSAMPGQAGNVVVAGHRTSKHAVFRHVDQLEDGDEIVYYDADGNHTATYAVREIRVIEPTEVWIIEPTETPTTTLFACHPPGSITQRIAVFADLIH